MVVGDDFVAEGGHGVGFAARQQSGNRTSHESLVPTSTETPPNHAFAQYERRCQTEWQRSSYREHIHKSGGVHRQEQRQHVLGEGLGI